MMPFQTKLRKYITSHLQLSPNDRLLLAVSGGVDSMVMLHALNQLADYQLSVATIHYGLRPESENEYRLVQHFCENHNIEFHLYKCTTHEIKSLKAGNLQEKARHIRHQWFRSLMRENKYQYLLTAHHRDDRIESFMLNAFRGAGLRGLTTLSARQGHIRRPLLFANKVDILNYAKEKEVQYLQDTSNLGNAYDRNFFRNAILPNIYDRHPRAHDAITQTIDNLASERDLLEYFVEQYRAKFFQEENNQIWIGPKTKLRTIPRVDTLLWYCLRPYGFSHAQIIDLIEAKNNNRAQIHSTTHQITDYEISWLLETRGNKLPAIVIHGVGTYQCGNAGSLHIQALNQQPHWTSDKHIEFVPAQSIQFPIILRPWQSGDRIAPLGMKGRTKLISDLLTDLKIKGIAKQNTLVLAQEDSIIWVVGQRLSEDYRSTTDTHRWLKLSWEASE